MSAAARQSRRRQRLKAGRIRLAFDVDEVGHVEMLIAAGYLDASQAEDRAAVNAATQRLTERLAVYHLARHA